ncbi:carbohydrate-binding protein [Acinetobacter sp. YH12021]|uniref:carbohydrate-binding protein n=1 Tax=Acinetobacter sp. YH12021 TaxID=2601040 RepID=UPI0015D32280|nr:carbohydrate-binding protein [Acinetobacter sp. YH12021]
MKTVLIKNNFSAGELSPTLYTRTDIQQYSNGAKRLKNVIPLVEGGVRKRPGTILKYVISSAVRLIPFIVNSDNSFLLALKPGQLTVFNPQTMAVVAQIAIPYTAEQIPDIQYVQYRFELFITHGEVPMQRLRCDEDFSNWNLSAFVFTHPPIDSDNARYPFRKGTPSGKDLGAFVTFTLDAVSAWSNSTTYLLGDVVIYSSQYYQAARDNSDKQPNTSTDDWVVVPNADGAGFAAGDVGRYLDVNGGLIKITKFNNVNSVSGEVVKKLDAVIKAIERSWVILPQAFNATDGYPRCCTYHKQRLVLANTKKAPNKIWFSAVGANGNYLETTEDGDAFSVVSASGLSNSILFLEAQRGVICLTSGGEFMVDSEGALSPTTVNMNEHSAYGAYSKARPERVGNELLFVQRGGERMRALTYRYEVDGLVSPEISALSSHIGEEHLGINEISYQQEPESIVWCVLGDGKVASITFNRDQEVLAWAQHDFGGTVISMCSIPTKLGSDRTFALIQRGALRIIEELSFDALVDCQQEISVTIEGQERTIAYMNNVSAYQWQDGSCFEVGEKVNGNTIKFNGLSGQTVKCGGTIECIVELFPPELNQNPLSSMMHKAKVDRIAFFFNKTLGAEINGQLIETFTFEDNLLGPKPPYTGFHLEEGGHWADLHKVPLIITHNKPLPFHMQAVTMQLSINEK